MEFIDTGALMASSPVAAALIWIAIKVIKPLGAKMVDALVAHGKSMTTHLQENTQAIEEAVEKQERAALHNAREHAAILKGMEILTDAILKAQGLSRTIHTDTEKEAHK